MGIRINKTLGWILEGEEIDLEVLKSFSLKDLQKENPNDKELNKLDLYGSNIDLNQPLISFVKNASLERFEENEAEDFLYVFIPPICIQDWHRHDDSIDYYEEDGIPQRKIKWLNGEVFPFSQKFVVSSTLKEIDNITKQNCWDFSNLNLKPKEPLKSNFKKLGFDLSKPLKSQIHMVCPKVLELILAKCSKVNHLKLKPGIVSYWS